MKKILLDSNFLNPFLATVGASFTILFSQFIYKFIDNRKKKLYAVTYMTRVCFHLLQSRLLVKTNTIEPHIKATLKILKGDKELLNQMFLSDEFDILTDSEDKCDNLPEEYKVMIGLDDMSLLQIFETVVFLNKTNNATRNLNELVKNNLKRENLFNSYPKEKKEDILNAYWDYLGKIKHTQDNVIAFSSHCFFPAVKKYINRKYFLFCFKKHINDLLKTESDFQKSHADEIPNPSFFEKSVKGGIQNLLDE